MSNEIKIKVGGDASELVTASTAAASRLDILKARLQKLQSVAANTQDFSKLNQALGLIKRTQTEINTLDKTVPFQSTVQGANQATNAMLNLGRVVQDAPFGFIGIANNINPLLESFQRLRAETGSTGATFKALGASLAGGAGLGLAVSLLTSGLTLFSMSGHGAAESLKGFAKAQKEANEEAGKELARVQVLNAVITDSTRSQTERSKAAKELSGILKDLNVNMSKEAILNGQVAEATKIATAAIIERAKARAIENRVAEISGDQLKRDLQRKDAVDKLAKATADLNDQQKIQRQVIGGSTTGVGGNTIAATQKVISLQNEIKGLDKASSEANKELQFLLGSIKNQDLNVEFKGGDDKIVDRLKQRIAALKEIQSLQGLDAKQQVELAQLEIELVKRDAVKIGFTPAEVKQQTQAILEKAFPVGTFEFDTIVTTRVNKLEFSPVKDAKPLTEDFKTDIAKAVNPSGKPIEVPAPPITFTNLDTEVEAAKKSLQAAVDSVTQGIQTEAFATIGEAIGKALTGGDVGKVFTDFFRFLADGLQRLGKALIAYGIALKGFQIAVKSLNPTAAILAGIGAVAAGVVLKASLPKFADGGIVNRPTLGIFGERGPEAIMPLAKIPSLINESLMRTLPNILANVNVNSQQPIVINGNMRVSGTDLSLMLERVQSRRTRLG